MSQPINTTRAHSISHGTDAHALERPISRSGSRSIGTASPALLTPTGTPPLSSAGGAGSSISSSAPRWNPFSEGRLQQLLSPFEAGTGWRGGEYDADARFAKRALSTGAAYVQGQGQGQGQGAGQGQGWKYGSGSADVPGQGAEVAVGDDGDMRDMIRRKSMPEGTGQPGSNTLRRPSLSFFSNLSMTRPTSASALQSHTSSPAPSTPASPAPASSGSRGHHDLKPLSEIPPANLPDPRQQAPGMLRSKTLPNSGLQQQQHQHEQRHFDPSREPKLHFM